MRARTSLAETVAAGVVVAFGLATIWLSSDFPMGTVTRMGAGYVPMALGIIITALGIAIALFDRSDERPRIVIALKPFAMILLGILLWALTVDRLGFFAASAILVVCCAVVEKGNTWRSVLALVVFMCVAGYLVFIEGLGIPLSAFGE
ncbi:MAG: tripartite tricarboxylate transporter TctB family protein [Rhodospirillaceae bacterium]|nr:tripartite tricarboxylate transporter TctB family protein [Rhodospirillaceae bacterium]MCA8934302.1 tripartite tricarboxylate transporter TctB family protein [Rhodospirillaceae bacterium]